MFKIKRKKIQIQFSQTPFTFIKLIPNFLTLLGLAIGASSIKAALEFQWEKAVMFILISAVIDGMDGKLARFLNASSKFGAELDSLADFINFGVAPGLIMYFWLLQITNHTLCWWSVVVYIICMAIRLARFNTAFVNPNDKLSKYFFTGVPAPAGAILSLVPIMVSFDIAADIDINIVRSLYFTPYYILFIGFLLASRFPTISLKNISIKREYVALMLIFFGVITIGLVSYPWYVIPITSAIYILTIPVCYFYAKKVCKV